MRVRDRDREIAKPTVMAAVATTAAAAMTTKFKPNDMRNFVWLFIVRRWITMWEIYCGDAFLRCRLLCVCLCVCLCLHYFVWTSQMTGILWRMGERERERTFEPEQKRVKGNGSQETYLQRRHGANGTNEGREVGGGAVSAQRPIISNSRMFVKPKPPNWNYTHTCMYVCMCVDNGRVLASSRFYKHCTLLLRASSLSFDSSGHLLCGWIRDVIYFSSCQPNAAIVSICIEEAGNAAAAAAGVATLQQSTKSQQPYYYRTILDSFNATE